MLTEERKFVHDIANPLAIAMFALDACLAERVARKESTEELRKVHAALERVQRLIAERRAALLESEKSVGKP